MDDGRRVRRLLPACRRVRLSLDPHARLRPLDPTHSQGNGSDARTRPLRRGGSASSLGGTGSPPSRRRRSWPDPRRAATQHRCRVGGTGFRGGLKARTESSLRGLRESWPGSPAWRGTRCATAAHRHAGPRGRPRRRLPGVAGAGLLRPQRKRSRIRVCARSEPSYARLRFRPGTDPGRSPRLAPCIRTASWLSRRHAWRRSAPYTKDYV